MQGTEWVDQDSGTQVHWQHGQAEHPVALDPLPLRSAKSEEASGPSFHCLCGSHSVLWGMVLYVTALRPDPRRTLVTLL